MFHLKYGREYKSNGNEKIPTGNIDKNIVIFSPTGDIKYTTMIKKHLGNNGHTYIDVYSKGLQIDSIGLDGSNLLFKINVENILTVKEFDILTEFIDSVNKK